MALELVERLRLGKEPKVVGTIITAGYLEKWRANPVPLPCDLVELRVDGFPDYQDWIETGKQIEKRGKPVIVTARLKSEGGKWEVPDQDRWRLLEPAIRELSGVDVEVRSELASAVSDACRKTGKLGIFSFHDFQKTPPREELERLLRRTRELGDVGKIAATANFPEEVELLRSLLREDWGIPICIVGMGALGRETRLTFPKEGSCFTYGYLDTAGAPGQYSAAELMERLRGPS